jgi:hypothetical protein
MLQRAAIKHFMANAEKNFTESERIKKHIQKLKNKKI